MVYLMLRMLKKICGSATITYRYTRKIAKYIHENPGYYLKHRKLYKLIKLYETWLYFAETNHCEPFEREVLYYIAIRSFWSDLEDEEFVSKLLVYLYRSDASLECIFYPDWEWLSSEKNVHYSRTCFAKFFLNLAYKNRLTIGVRRIVDLHIYYHSFYKHPCEIAIITRSTDLLRLLLRYGAFSGGGRLSVRGLPLNVAITTTFSVSMNVIKSILDMSSAEGWKIKEVLENGENARLIECGKLMMRVCPQFKKHAVFKQMLSIPVLRNAKRALLWVAHNVIPEITYRIFQPMSLKHACRLKVRYALHVNWQLPYGIEELPIPDTLKRYLDLHCD